MAEEDNVALIRTIYSAFSTGDIKTILENVSADAQWVNYGPETIPYAGDFTGRIKEFFVAIDQSTTGGKVIPEKFIGQDDNVVSIGRYTASVRNTEAKIDTPIAHVFTVSGGKVTTWTGFSDSAAVAAAHASSDASIRS
jgi:ketosteroid isomerase-like protein